MSEEQTASEKNFSEIHQKEINLIHTLRESNKQPAADDAAIKNSLVGLAFSGGGIRSATFGLGVLEALKAKGLLKKIDYLSTVSGGGYIGSWLSANCYRTRKRIDEKSSQQNDKTSPECNKSWLDTDSDWSDSITHLRRYSNYLSPNLSLLSADTWSMVTIWLRNTLLLQTMIVLVIASLLLIPRLLVPVIDWDTDGLVQWVIAGVFTYLIGWLALNLIQIKISESGGTRGNQSSWINKIKIKPAGQTQVQFHVLILLVVSLGFSVLLWQYADPKNSFGDCLSLIKTNAASFWWFLLLPYLGMTLLSACSSRDELSSFLFAILPTLVMYLMFAFILYWLGDWKHVDCVGTDKCVSGKWPDNSGTILAFAWAPPMVLAAISLAINILIGMQGNSSFEYVREWWSRFGAWLAIYGAAWMLVVLVAFYGPLGTELLYYEGPWTSLGSGWLVTIVSGVLAGKSSSTGNSENANFTAKAMNMLSKATPFIFIAGLLIVVSLCLHLFIANTDKEFTADRSHLIGCQIAGPISCQVGSQSDRGPSHLTHWQLLAAGERDMSFLRWLFVVCLALIYVLNRRIDINEFSLNAFYRNRLARCYLGASRKPAERNPHEFTGFDRADDIELYELIKNSSLAGPFHIINCALNLGGSNDLALHTRHSATFTLTPSHCGSSYIPKKANGEPESYIGNDPKQLGYRATDKYCGSHNRTTLGLAISVSGAAASPNMGYHTSAPVAFLMTLFNVRLGWWFPNPGKSLWNTPSPKDSLRFLLEELFGTAKEKDDYLAISDGGHFENLAGYELIKRRCRVVIISDGECDPKMQFEGLANLIRLAEVDLDAKIEIDVSDIHPAKDFAWSRNRCAVGKIEYDELSTRYPNPPDGDCWLIYIKAAMNGHEDTAIMQYKATHPDFPHETTGDQFYAEDQFESYRNLGKDITENLFGKWDKKNHDFVKKCSVDKIAKQLYDILSTELPNYTQFTRHTDRLIKIWNELSNSENLADQLFPLEDNGAKSNETKLNQVIFYKCSEMIQLMENVYLDLNLEDTWDHTDNRGWQKLFVKWANTPLLKATWDLSKDTYGIRFQSFWERKLS